jgi:hypothetical protein
MIIAGGTYYESCQFPPNTDFFGPGLRAAAATAEIIPSQNELHTPIGRSDQSTLETYADTFDLTVQPMQIPETITFDYLHNHSNPKMEPSDASKFNCRITTGEGDAVLRFGLAAGTAVVSGDRVVYDPQSPTPTPFHQNGSSANELALVLNFTEAKQLAGEEQLDAIFSVLTTGEQSADVVVIKRGARGSIVRTPTTRIEVPVVRTESVWGIGSGDVFSGVFAAEWAANQTPPAEAAIKASRATATYCQLHQLPITQERIETICANSETIFIPPDADPPKFYLAGPFFSIGERYLIEEVKHILEDAGISVISPIHDIGRAADYDRPEDIAQQDLDAIEDSDLVFALLDHLDSGTQFELGYARKAEIPVIGYAHNFSEDDKIMTVGSGCQIYQDLASAIYNSIWTGYD